MTKALTKPKENALTKAEVHDLRAEKKIAQLMGEIRAFAREAGIDPDTATLEELCEAYLEGYRKTIETAHGKNISNMKTATNARGMEQFNRLYLPTDDQKQPPEPTPSGAIVAPPAALMELVEMIEKRQIAAIDRARAIDAESTENIPETTR